MSKKAMRVLCFLLGVVTAGVGHTYEVFTHQQLSLRAAERSRLWNDTSILANAEMPARAELAYPATTGGNTDLVSLIMIGAAQEDNDYLVRVFNHFFDVQYNNFAGRGMSVAGLTGNPSPDWAIEDTADIGDRNIVAAQIYSVRQLQQYYLQSFTASSRSDRITYFGRAMEAAGHVIHHVQDMAQPQHVRNDQHTHPIPGTSINPDWSFYERYTWDKLDYTSLDQILNNPNNAYTPPIFGTSRQYWHTPNAGARYVGMAEFTANNYVTFGKSFRGSFAADGSLIISGNLDEPLPNGQNVDGTQKTVGPWTGTLTLSNGQQRTGTFDFVYGSVYDGNTGGYKYNQRLAGFSVLDKYVAMRPPEQGFVNRQAVFSENSKVYEDRYNVLLPRAVAFSTGLLDHMFRGRLNIARGTTAGSWLITNLSGPVSNGQTIQQSINGVLSLYYDDASNVRRPIPGASSQTVNLGYGQSVQMGSLEPPSGATKVIAAFAGRIGSEGDPSGTGFFAVAGKVIPVGTPPVACQGLMKVDGGTPGNTYPFIAGSTAANLPIEFEAYGIPDEIIIKSGTGAILDRSKTVAGGNGVMSGYKLFNIPYNPQTLGTTSLSIQINAPNPQTEWSLTVNCPGTAITDQDRNHPRIPVSFQFGDFLQGAAFGCQADMYIDYVLIGRAQFQAPTRGSLGVTLSKGQAHAIEFKNYSCQPQTSNVIGSAYYQDSRGVLIKTQSMTQTGVGYFDVK